MERLITVAEAANLAGCTTEAALTLYPVYLVGSSTLMCLQSEVEDCLDELARVRQGSLERALQRLEARRERN